MSGYKNHSFQIHTDGMGAAVNLPDITAHSFDLNATIEQFTPPTGVYPTHQSATRVENTKTISTEQVEDWLDTIGVGGLCIKSTSNPGCKLFEAKLDECAAEAAGSVHRSLQIRSGFIYPKTLTVEHLGHAKLDFEAVLLYDGSNDPIVIADNVALPSLTITSSRWTLGQMTIGAVTMADFTRLAIDFGFQIEAKSRQSDHYDTTLEVKKSNPTIEVTTEKPTHFSLADFPVGGKACTHANSILYLRKRLANGTAGFVSDVTAEHLKFTADGVAFPMNPSQADGDKFVTNGIKLTCQQDGSGNAPIIYTGASAIT